MKVYQCSDGRLSGCIPPVFPNFCPLGADFCTAAEPLPDIGSQKSCSSTGCAVQYSCCCPNAPNAGVLPLKPMICAGAEIQLDENGLLFQPENLYLISYHLKAHTGAGYSGEAAVRIDGVLHPEFSALSSAAPCLSCKKSDSTACGTISLTSGFLYSAAGKAEPPRLELVFYTSAPGEVPVSGNLYAVKLGRADK